MSLTKCKDCDHEISKSAKDCPNCGSPQKKEAKQYSLLSLIILGVLVWWVYGIFTTDHTKPDPMKTAMNSMELDYNWNKVGFDNVMEANFAIKNNGSRNVKDIEIKCSHYSNSGSKIDSNTRTIYEVVSAKSTKSIQKMNMGFIHNQATKTNCKITNLKL